MKSMTILLNMIAHHDLQMHLNKTWAVLNVLMNSKSGMATL